MNIQEMHNPKYCLFYDNHTMPACPDVGENFDAELFTYYYVESIISIAKMNDLLPAQAG